MPTYVVDQATGNDANSGSDASPWATFHRGLAVPVAGDTVLVRNGTYNAGTGFFSPTNAGVSGAPIAFRRYPGHTPVLTRTLVDTTLGYDAVLSVNRDWTIFDGFQIATPFRVDAWNDNITIENMALDIGELPCLTGNRSGIGLNGVDNATIRNNRVKGPRFATTGGPCNPGNAAGIYFINSHFLTITNNEVSDTGNAIKCKRVGHNVAIANNYVHDIAPMGFGIDMTYAADASCSGDGCRTSDFSIHHNIVVGASIAISMFNDGTNLMRDISIYNNTLYNAQKGWVGSNGGPGFKFYNNIVHATDLPGTDAHVQFFGVPPIDLLEDYNCYRGFTDAKLRSVAGEFTLANWRATYNLDLASTLSDPLFVGPLTNVNGFKLQTGSPAIGAGRVGGIPSGATCNMGAYETGNEVIGLLNAPAAPMNLQMSFV